MEESATVYFNPSCSKCRSLKGLLEERGVAADYRLYLQKPPSVAELEEVLRKLGTDDPRVLVRTKEAAYQELGLADAGRADLLQAITEHPELLVRPIFVLGDQAVVARPPSRALDLL